MPTLVVLALDGMMASTLALTLDTLRAGLAARARLGGAGGGQVLVAGHRRRVRLDGGMQLRCDLSFATLLRTAPRPAWVIVPGLGLMSDAAIDAFLVRADAQAALRLLRQLPAATEIGASCSAVFLLAQAGLLDGRACTTTWWLARLFRQRFAQVQLDEHRMLVRDGRMLTAGSAFAQLDLTLAVVADSMGAAVADLVGRYLLIDRRPSQARYMAPSHSRHADPTVVAAERWIDAHIAGPIAVGALAGALGVTPRTLARRLAAAVGVSPVRFIQHRRLQHAVHLIETTGEPLESIAAAVGYQDGTSLWKLIKREHGVTPAALRR